MPRRLKSKGLAALTTLRDFALRETGAVAALLVAAAATLSFLEIADDMAEGDTLAVDRAVLLYFREPADVSEPIGPHWLDLVALDVTALGSVTVLALIIVLVTGLFLSLRHFREAAVLLLASASAAGVSQSLKLFFDRERPEQALRAVEVFNPSFPSGHALSAAVVYLTLGVLVARFTERRRIKVYALASAVLITVLVGFSRVYLGVHWPSDVLAGWCIGAAWALSWWLLIWLLERRLGPGVVDDKEEGGAPDQ